MSFTSRRYFIRTTLACMGGALLFPLTTLRQDGRIELAKLTSEAFLPLVNKEFQINSRDGKYLSIKLVSVDKMNHLCNSCTRRIPFTLLWESQSDSLLENKIYLVKHPELGSFSLFLHKVGPSEGTTYVEAIFA